MAVTTQRRYTVDDLANFPDDGRRREMVDGQIVEWDVTSLRHGAIANLLATLITLFVRQHRLGTVITTDALIRIFGSQQHARGGDIAFFAQGRLPADLDAAAADVAPDLVVDIHSPNDRADRVQAKIHDWLRIGVRLLWYVDPATGITAVYGATSTTTVAPDEPLDGGDVLPGFTVRMSDLLAELADEQRES